VLWLLSAVGFTLWAVSAGDAANVLYGWPGPWLLLGSSAALAAAMVSLGMLALLPGAWRSDARHGWSLGRRLRHTATALIFAAAAGLLASWGALQPWSA
jgi:quinol-cytochrome oxidoreductase complex cytochrome b subunit